MLPKYGEKAFGGQHQGLTGSRPLYMSEYRAGASASSVNYCVLMAYSPPQLQEKPFLHHPRGPDEDIRHAGYVVAIRVNVALTDQSVHSLQLPPQHHDASSQATRTVCEPSQE